MKRYFLFINTILLLFISFTQFIIIIPVSSEQNPEYLRVITEDTPFYSDEECKNLLFYLPYTYYVKFLDKNENYTHVELICNYFVVDGYVPNNTLYSDNLKVNNPYPSIQIKTLSTTTLYSDYNLQNTIQYIFPNRTLYYYGKITAQDNSVMYYVSYNNKLGYVKEETLESFSIENHPNELTFIKKEEEKVVETVAPVEEKKTDTTTIRIMIIICLIISAVLTAFVVVKRKPEQKSTVKYYDENDYE